MTILTKLKKTMREQTTHVTDRYFSVELTKGLREGRLILKTQALRNGIEKALEEQNAKDKAPDLFLKDFFCSKEDMLINLSTAHKGTQITLIMRLQVLNILFDKDEQSVCMRVKLDKPLGNNTLGKVACAVASSIVEQMVRDAIATNKLVSEVNEGTDNALLVNVDLSGVKIMKSLSKDIPILNKSPFDFITLHSICHDQRGLIFTLGKV